VCCSVMLCVTWIQKSEREREESRPTHGLYQNHLLLEHSLILSLRSSACSSIALHIPCFETKTLEVYRTLNFFIKIFR
jgi:hypothetical protein